MEVLVGSRNPVKLEAAEEAFSKHFAEVDIIGIEVDSKVSHQPINEQAFEGAKNGASESRRTNKQRDAKQEQGAVGYFAKGILDRKRIYVDGLVAALVPFLNESLRYRR